MLIFPTVYTLLGRQLSSLQLSKVALFILLIIVMHFMACDSPSRLNSSQIDQPDDVSQKTK